MVTTLTDLEKRIKSCLRKMDLSDVQAHIESVHKRLDEGEENYNFFLYTYSLS